MVRSMTGFGRCFLEDEFYSQIWEIRSVNGRYLDIRWRLPAEARVFESALERVVKQTASRGRLEISLNLSLSSSASTIAPVFNADLASAMLDELERLAAERGEEFLPDYTRLMSINSLWQCKEDDADDSLAAVLEKGLEMALADWNEARQIEGRALVEDLQTRFLRMESWIDKIRERAPDIKEERFATVLERINELLGRVGQELEETRFLQETALLADKVDVSEELTRLAAHMDRLRELIQQGVDAGRKLDFTLQECFREITTCGNKIQDIQIARLVVDVKNELEKCREQVQNIE